MCVKYSALCLACSGQLVSTLPTVFYCNVGNINMGGIRKNEWEIRTSALAIYRIYNIFKIQCIWIFKLTERTFLHYLNVMKNLSPCSETFYIFFKEAVFKKNMNLDKRIRCCFHLELGNLSLEETLNVGYLLFLCLQRLPT